jgi:hypothetical protein
MNGIALNIAVILQMLPKLLLIGLISLSVLLANQAVVLLTACCVGFLLLLNALNQVIIRMSPETAVVSSVADMCTSGIFGKSWARLITSTPDLLWHPYAPSLYTAVIAFVAGWGFALQTLYRDEINAGVLSRSNAVATSVLSTILLLVVLAVRIFMNQCDSILAAVSGAAIGLFMGYVVCLTIGAATDRRATNLWGIPLLRDRINNGSAVFICPK